MMYLPLAEKMTLKYIQEGKLEAEAGTSFYASGGGGCRSCWSLEAGVRLGGPSES